MNILQKVKEKGLKKSFRIAFQHLKPRIKPGYQKLYIFEIILKEKYPDIKLKEGMKIEIVKDVNELSEFSKRRGDWYNEYAKDLLDKGNLCFVMKVDGKIASCVWTSFKNVKFNDVQYDLKVTDNIAPLIDGYTLEEYRGMGIYRIIWNYCVNYLIDMQKFDRIYGGVLNCNKRSLKVHDKLNLNKVIMEVILIKGLGFRFHVIKKY